MENDFEKKLNRNNSPWHNSRRITSFNFYNSVRWLPKRNLQLFAAKSSSYSLLFVTLFTLFMPYPGHSQTDMDYAIHANIVYRFTKYIDWPENKKNGDFIIGIVGDSPLYDELKNFIANKRVRNQKIIIKRFSSSESVFNCHILFISEEKSTSMKKIVATTKGTSTLIVSESDGMARKGACINFIVIDDRIKLEINKTNIEDRDLSIATELLSLGIIVR